GVDNKDCSVESPVVVEKKTVVPTIAKVEVVRPKQQEKPVRKTLRPRAANTARPRAINTARPNSAVLNAVRANQVTAKVKTVNGEEQIQALVDKKKVIIIETSVRSDLHLEDAEGAECLPTATILKQLTLMGSTMASAIICLATNQKFNFSKYIFDHMMKNLKDGVKFLMFPRFVQVFLDTQVEGMVKHKEIYVTPSHTKKIFANMKRHGKDFSGKGSNHQDMFDTSILDDEEVVAEKEVSIANPVPTAGEVVTTADYELAARLQEEKRGELTIEEKSRLFVELMDKRKKYFARLRAKKIRKSFVPMDTELVNDSEKASEDSSKRTGGKLEQDDAKRQRI
nr:hypothetical protein [Tanacetum cinerariifolium]